MSMLAAMVTYRDEGLVDAVEAKVPDDPPTEKGRNVPEAEVGDHHERGRGHHPVIKGVRGERYQPSVSSQSKADFIPSQPTALLVKAKGCMNHQYQSGSRLS